MAEQRRNYQGSGYTTNAVGRSYDAPSNQFAALVGEPNGNQYVLDGKQQYLRIDISGNDADPNTVAPTDIFAMACRSNEILWHVVWPAGGSGSVRVWGKEEVEPGTWAWLLMDTAAAVLSYVEQRSPARDREVFFEFFGTAGLAAKLPGPPAVAILRAAAI